MNWPVDHGAAGKMDESTVTERAGVQRHEWIGIDLRQLGQILLQLRRIGYQRIGQTLYIDAARQLPRMRKLRRIMAVDKNHFSGRIPAKAELNGAVMRLVGAHDRSRRKMGFGNPA